MRSQFLWLFVTALILEITDSKTGFIQNNNVPSMFASARGAYGMYRTGLVQFAFDFIAIGNNLDYGKFVNERKDIKDILEDHNSLRHWKSELHDIFTNISKNDLDNKREFSKTNLTLHVKVPGQTRNFSMGKFLKFDPKRMKFRSERQEFSRLEELKLRVRKSLHIHLIHFHNILYRTPWRNITLAFVHTATPILGALQDWKKL